MRQRISLLLPYYFADTKFPELFESMGFDVFCAGGHDLRDRIIETEDYVRRHQPDLALEWQRGPDDCPIHDIIKKYNRQTPVFLMLNWNGCWPTHLHSIDYAGYLTLPLKLEEFMSKFYLALTGCKRKLFEHMLADHCPNLCNIVNESLDAVWIEDIIVILNRVEVFEKPEIDGMSRILLVDDEPGIRDSLKEFLESFTDYSVFSESNGWDGMEFLEKNPVDLVVTDIFHPGMNGLELTKFIKENLDSEVIIMTGYTDLKYDDAIAAGASELYYKPVRLQEMLAIIRKVLRKRSGR